MKYSRVVITCGVSAFLPSNALRKWAEHRQLLRFPKDSPDPQPIQGKDESATLKELDKELANRNSLDAILTDPERVCAEYSALHSLQKEQRIADAPQVVLIHTSTFGGKVVARVLDKLLARRFNATVECDECTINVNDRTQLRYNLGDFMHKVAKALKAGHSSTTCFAPLGGYKVMTSLGYLVGAYLGFPTLYMHEDKQVVHEIPPIPVKVSEEELRRLAPLLKKVGNGYERDDLTDAEQSLLDSHAWLFEHTDNIVAVNEFGIFLMHENPHIFKTKICVSAAVSSAFASDGRRRFISQQFHVLSVKLNSGSTEADLRHEREWNDLSPDDDWHLFKGASNGQQIMRAIYRWSEQDDTLYVKFVWTNHDDYEREFKSQWGRQVSDFDEWDTT